MARYPVLVLAVVLAGAAAVQAQDNPMSKEAKSDYEIVKQFVIRAAEKVPEAGYAFKPTPEVRNFGQLIGHMADDQYEYCGPVKGEHKSSSFEEKTPAKAEMVVALKSAFAYCDSAYAALTDASGTEKVNFRGRNIPRLLVLTHHAGHAWEHYGNVVVYMRLQGLVPPSSEMAAK